MASDWPDKQDWESLSAAVRAEANAAMIEEWYQKGEKSFCEFVQDMARKHSDRQDPGEAARIEGLAITESTEQGPEEPPNPTQEKPKSQASKLQVPQGSQPSSNKPEGEVYMELGVAQEPGPRPARCAARKRAFWPDQPPTDSQKRKPSGSLERIAQYAALAPSTQKLGKGLPQGVSPTVMAQGFEHGSSGDEGMGGDPSLDWLPSDSSDDSGGDSGPLKWPLLQKSAKDLVEQAEYLLERSGGETQGYETVIASQLLMVREAYIRRADRVLHSLLSRSHAGEDELNKARERIKGRAAKYELALQLFEDA